MYSGSHHKMHCSGQGTGHSENVSQNFYALNAQIYYVHQMNPPKHEPH